MLPDALKKMPEVLWARRMVWLYFWLLIFEGAIRKWALPSLANPLLIMRDPVVVLIYLLAASRNRFPMNGFIGFSLVMSFLLGASAMMFGHGNLWVTLFGLRTNFLHLPLIFVIPQLFSLNDVKTFGRAIMWISLPMAGLIVAQFFAPGWHRLNAAVGGTAGQIIGAMGHVRPSGTFSFVTGVTSFLSLQCAFIIGAFINKEAKVLRSLSLIALMLALVCSISRSALVACGAVLAATAMAIFINPKRMGRGALFLVLLAVVGLALSTTSVFQSGQRVMSARIEDAKMGEVTTNLGFAERIWNDLTDPFKTFKNVTLAGAGTGAGTNVGAQLLVGTRGFFLAEIEWSRLMLESGLILGPFVVGLRIVLSFYLLWWGYQCLKKSDNWMPWLIIASIFPWVFNAPWGQPTMLGFACLGAGFVLAATRPSFETHPLFKHAYAARRP